MSAVLQRQKPHASAAAEALREAALKPYEALKDVVGSVAKAIIRLRSVEDLVELMQAVNAISLAADALAESAKDLHETADAALAASMSETGGTTLRTEHHVVSLRQNAPSVDIPDVAAVPLDFFTIPKPIPDRAKIRAALKADPSSINWAVLKGGSIGLQRRPIQ